MREGRRSREREGERKEEEKGRKCRQMFSVKRGCRFSRWKIAGHFLQNDVSLSLSLSLFSLTYTHTHTYSLSLFQTHTHTRFLLFLSDFLSLTQSLCLYFIFLSKRNTIKLNEESKTLRFREIYFSWVIFSISLLYLCNVNLQCVNYCDV